MERNFRVYDISDSEVSELGAFATRLEGECYLAHRMDAVLVHGELLEVSNHTDIEYSLRDEISELEHDLRQAHAQNDELEADLEYSREEVAKLKNELEAGVARKG